MWSLTIQLMKKSIKMLIPAGIAILIGAAFITSTFLFGNTLTDSLNQATTRDFGNSTYTISYASKADDSQTNYSLGDIHINQIRALDGVSGLSTGIDAYVSLSYQGKTSTTMALQVPFGNASRPATISRGRMPSGEGEIALPQALLSRLGAGQGKTILVFANSSASQSATRYKAKIMGITEDTSGLYAGFGGASLLSTDLAVKISQSKNLASAPFTKVYITLKDQDSQAQAATIKQIRSFLPKGVNLQSKEEASRELVEENEISSKIVTTFLLVFGIIALFVAALVISNTFQVMVAQRRRTLAILRTIGAGKKQLYQSVVMEAFLLGLVASALGILAGVGIMALVIKLGVLKATGASLHLVLTWQALLVPLIFGTIMTIFASLSSARSATSVTPLEALRPLEITAEKKGGKARGIFSALLVLVGLVLAFWAIRVTMNQISLPSAKQSSDTQTIALLTAIAACIMIFLGLILSSIFWLPRAMKGAGKLVSLTGPAALIAHGNIQKNPRRIAATGIALLIGVTLVSTIATGAASGKATLTGSLSDHYSVDAVITGDGADADAVNKVKAVDGVKNAILTPMTTGTVTDARGGKKYIALAAVNSRQDLQSVLRVSLPQHALDRGTILLPSKIEGKQWSIDHSQVTFTTDNDQAAKKDPLSLTAVQTPYQSINNNYAAVGFINSSYFADKSLTAYQGGNMILVSLNVDSSQAGTVISAINDALSKSGNISVSGVAATRYTYEQIIDRIMLLLVGLLAVAVLIALIGVANTLSLSVIERTRESATLRALGMTRGQLRLSLAVEALLLATVSGLLGIILGTLFGWLGSFMIFSTIGKMVFPVSWGMDFLVLGISALAALLASIIPAHRAVSTPPVEALAEA
ncbi:ABC transporter permease [Scardovia inopinata]|uniref:ABC3 transporter permease C-terminal domain-containing protein n=2 Tax=Scardovia inopinata TaxID=78259 RepID=W5IHB9_SCAIO|nr:FtsX-like permease family protein [Scardovia inopinata]EFG26251.1 hypothetical protein HMPREF9020_01333 [Scardovia inopinata F0304]BAR07118.1 putative transport protein [Scardovia inopinata JCM 12537]SUV51188.1 ABC transporter permease [Scardovia inopinata]